MDLHLHRIKQEFKASIIEDIPAEVRAQLDRVRDSFSGKKNIALGVGSRGISNINIIVKTVVNYLKDIGASPFIVPAMGSHGGATAEGQAQILREYGIDENTMGVPVRSSMEVVELSSDGLENRLFMDKNAFNSDGVILINRIKPHTDFHGPYESGISKMSVIGLGKQRQAIEMHNQGVHGLKDLMPLSAKRIFDSGKIIAGIAIIENAYDQTMMIKSIPVQDIPDEELKLIQIARDNMPSLPLSPLHILIIDRMGKDISGVGMDTNITGRLRMEGYPDPENIKIDRIMVCDLTEATHGNAAGIGLADCTTQKLFDKIDIQATRENVATSTFLERGKIPIVAATDAQAFEICKRSCGPIKEEELRIIRIKDTLHLSDIFVSPAVWENIKDRPEISLSDGDQSIFDNSGNLIPF